MPLELWLEVDLVAVDNGLSLLVGRHQGGETADGVGGGVSDEDVPQPGGLHLLELLGGVPFPGGVFVVGAASFFDEGEAALEVAGGEVGRAGDGESVEF
jgi:hypothetical protein